MLTFRPFRNLDPPVITELWRSCTDRHGLYMPVSPDLFEQLVFAKLYFDYDGLIIAYEDDRPVGFIHAGFGPNEELSRVSTELGIHCLTIVRPDCDQAGVAAGLLEQSEGYLRRRGAKVFYGGCVKPRNPFYLGLYGGSELPGVLHNDAVALEMYRAHGYREVDDILIFRRDLTDFEGLIDRYQMQIRRQMIVEMSEPIPSHSWWEACTLGDFDLTRFELIPRSGGAAVASTTFRTMEPVGTLPIGRTMGLIDFRVEPSLRRRGLAVFLMTEAFRQFIRQGVVLVEAQCARSNTAACRFYEKLGFQQHERGSVFLKEATAG